MYLAERFYGELIRFTWRSTNIRLVAVFTFLLIVGVCSYVVLNGTRRELILRPGRLSSVIEFKRIRGPIFNSKEAAEEHGLKLCKDWIDKRP
jgi:hypothetical protein